ICEQVAGLGARLVAVDADQVAGEQVAAAIREGGADACFVAADVSDAADTEAYVAQALTRFGRIDGLVTPIADYPLEVFDRVLAINARGVFLGLKHVLPPMVAQRSGSIVNVASVSGTIGHVGHSAYVASKHAVVGLTRVAAAEVARHGVRVNALCPGPTSTRMMDAIEAQSGDGDAAATHREIAAKIPAQRYAEPQEVARVAAFLLGDDAAFVHGAAIAVDGGFTAAI